MSRKSATRTTFCFGIVPPPYEVVTSKLRPLRVIFHTFNQFVHALGLQNCMLVTHIALVIDFDQYVAITAGENPFSGVIRGANDRCLIAQSLVLAEIEITEDNYHSKFVRTIDNAFEPLHVVRPQGAILRDGGIVPRLVFRVTLRRAAL